MHRTIFDADHEEFRGAVRGFLRTTVEGRVHEFIDQGAIPDDVWLEAGKQGLLGLQVPELYGGSGADDFRFSAVLTEELAKVTAAFASCFGIHSDIVTQYLVELGTHEQKERWLPAMCRGEIRGAIGMTESSGGTDLTGLRTTAVRVGADWVLNGSKTFITNGSSAELIVLAARTDPANRTRGITLFAVEASMPGVTRGRKLDKVGQSEADTAELFFEDVILTDQYVIGEVDQGFGHMMARLPHERLCAAVSNLAHAGQILAETIAYVRERRAFGTAIGSFQYNKFKLAELVTLLDVSQTHVDALLAAHVAGRVDPVDTAKAKWWTSQVQNDVLDACVQLYGGYGYMNEYRVGRAWRDARVTKIWAGTNEIMKELIGRDLGL